MSTGTDGGGRMTWKLTCPKGHRGIVRGPPGAEFRCAHPECDRAYSLVQDVRIERTISPPSIRL